MDTYTRNALADGRVDRFRTCAFCDEEFEAGVTCPACGFDGHCYTCGAEGLYVEEMFTATACSTECARDEYDAAAHDRL